MVQEGDNADPPATPRPRARVGAYKALRGKIAKQLEAQKVLALEARAARRRASTLKEQVGIAEQTEKQAMAAARKGSRQVSAGAKVRTNKRQGEDAWNQMEGALDNAEEDFLSSVGGDYVGGGANGENAGKGGALWDIRRGLHGVKNGLGSIGRRAGVATGGD